MKFAIPEISWHNRDPVLSVDFQPKVELNGPLRLATGGTDSHVLIWYTTLTETGSVNLEVAADLTRHQKSVNVVRWSPSGQYLASGDDESIIFIWKQKTEEVTAPLEGEEIYKETWVVYKTLRGHMEDILDLSWNSTSTHLASGSVDNKVIVWDVQRGRYTDIVPGHKGFVQGVTWDPQSQYIATTSSDRVFRAIDVASKKVVSRSNKAVLPLPKGHALHGVRVRLYHDDTLQTYYRRLQFSPDGLLIAVPAGKLEPDQGKLDTKPINVVYIYTRFSLKVPVCVIPCAEPAVAVRWAPTQFLPRSGPHSTNSAFPLPARSILAVATRRSVLLYDTQQKAPLALISNIHYTRMTDLSWSPDSRVLVVSSTDGFCSLITFAPGELGTPLPEHTISTIESSKEPKEVKNEAKNITNIEQPKVSTGITKIDSFIKFKTPSEKSPKKQKTEVKQKTPVKMDIFMETAMPSWSDNSSNDIIKPKECEPMEVEKNDEVMVIEDSEDIKLIYDDTEGRSQMQSPNTKSNTSENVEVKKSPNNEKTSKNKNSSKQDKMTVKQGENSSKQSEILSKQDETSSKPSKTSLKQNELPSKQDETSEQSESSKQDETSSKKSVTPTSKLYNFLKQAKVTDVKEAVPVKTVPSPRAPRRVNFVTLSSPKNKKKL